MNGRFDYTSFDKISQEQQKQALGGVMFLESVIEKLTDRRSAKLAMLKLEEAYMWIGKAIRDDQLQRETKY